MNFRDWKDWKDWRDSLRLGLLQRLCPSAKASAVKIEEIGKLKKFAKLEENI